MIDFSKYGYSITLCGKIYSDKSGRYLKPRIHTSGYHQVTLWCDGKQHDRFIHRLVAEVFIDNPEGKRCVNHIDGNKLNNHFKNLEWCTDSENQKHAYSNGLNSRNGINNGKSKLTEQKVRDIRRLRKQGETVVSIAKKFGISEAQAREIIKLRAWKHVKS